MAGTGTWGTLTVDPDYRVFTGHLMDASGDTWTEQLFVAIGATYAAIQAWWVLYQITTQASVYGVTEERGWVGDADPDNAEFLARSGVENGINLSFKDPDTRDTRPLRVVAPVAATMQGNQDIPLLSSDELSDLIIATAAFQPTYEMRAAQYTTHRERKGNPRVK